MAKLTDPEVLTCYCNALANWRYDGYVEFLQRAAEWLDKELGERPRDFAQRLHEFVAAGGEIDQVVETRPEWNFWTHHYDLRLDVNGRLIYVETRLKYRDPTDSDDPVIYVVNIHLV